MGESQAQQMHKKLQLPADAAKGSADAKKADATIKHAQRI